MKVYDDDDDNDEAETIKPERRRYDRWQQHWLGGQQRAGQVR